MYTRRVHTEHPERTLTDPCLEHLRASALALAERRYPRARGRERRASVVWAEIVDGDVTAAVTVYDGEYMLETRTLEAPRRLGEHERRIEVRWAGELAGWQVRRAGPWASGVADDWRSPCDDHEFDVVNAAVEQERLTVHGRNSFRFAHPDAVMVEPTRELVDLAVMRLVDDALELAPTSDRSELNVEARRWVEALDRLALARLCGIVVSVAPRYDLRPVAGVIVMLAAARLCKPM